jgi:hypothetical protein
MSCSNSSFMTKIDGLPHDGRRIVPHRDDVAVKRPIDVGSARTRLAYRFGTHMLAG